MKSVVVDLAAYDWAGDRPLDRPFAETVIYEAHVRGFTAHPSSRRRSRAPGHVCRVHREDPVPRRPRRHGGRAAARVRSSTPRTRPAAGPTTGATSRCRSSRPTPRTAAGPAPRARSTSSATSSRRSTGPGLEVILDVVYNHTAEGGDGGPTFAYRGLANDEYYILDRRTGPATPTTAAAATRSTPTSPSSAG